MFGRSGEALLALLGAGLLLQTACTCGSGPYEGDYLEGDRPGALAEVDFKESEKGDPKVIGCADGQREGFADAKTHPEIAGCLASWDDGKSLRDPPTGKACGDDGEKCTTPADACAEGWHLCGAKGDPQDLRERVDAEACHNAGPGRFNAALSHSPTDEIKPCPKVGPNTKLPCVQAGMGSEPVCCGNDCKYGKCRDGVWKGKTKISRGTTEGCGAVTSARNGGVLCCADRDVTAEAAAGEGAEAEAGAEVQGAAGAGAAEGEPKAGDGDEAKAEGEQEAQ